MSISVTVLTGQYAGKTAIMPDNIKPLRLLVRFAKQDVRWGIDYTKATTEEAQEWSRADMAARIIAALSHGRIVRFLYYEWAPTNLDEINKAVEEIEDAIGHSGTNVYVETDDETGVTIGVYRTQD